MELRSIAPNCAKPIQIDGTDPIAMLRGHLESALLIADDLDLAMIGVDLDQALNRLPAPPFRRT